MTDSTSHLKKGKAAEAYVWMRLLESGMVPYLPFVDAEGIDAVVRTSQARMVPVQVKSRDWPVEWDDFGEQVKGLPAQPPFEFLIIVLPLPNEAHPCHEAWVVPKAAMQKRLSPGGDLTMSRRLMHDPWEGFREAWTLIGQPQNEQ